MIFELERKYGSLPGPELLDCALMAVDNRDDVTTGDVSRFEAVVAEQAALKAENHMWAGADPIHEFCQPNDYEHAPGFNK